MGQRETADSYKLIVERHHKTATILTSNRDPSESIRVDERPGVDRLTATSYELLIEGESYPPPTTTPNTTSPNGVSS
jgi:hypothetical protein